jgi:hypothetical protein
MEPTESGEGCAKTVSEEELFYYPVRDKVPRNGSRVDRCNSNIFKVTY